MNPNPETTPPPAKAFTPPADGLFMIEAKGEHRNADANVIQVIDDTAIQSIVKNFNAAADKPGFAGMLIDHEHFKHNPDKETTAYGWLMRLLARSDGIYGQIRWTGTGQQAIDAGDYRYFSTEYDLNDATKLNPGQKPARVRPMKLDGITLTNMNNNKGQKPITNRAASGLASESTQPMQSESENNVIINRAIGDLRHAYPRMSYSTARDCVRQSSPELFGLPPKPAAPAPRRVENRQPEIYTERRNLAEDYAKLHKVPFTTAWNRVRAARPDLFDMESDSSPEQSATAIAMNRFTAENGEPPRYAPLGSSLKEAVEEYRVKNRCRSFGEAWNHLRTIHPELFATAPAPTASAAITTTNNPPRKQFY